MTTQEYIKVFEEYRMRVFFFCKKTIDHREEAEDITISIFVKLWERKELIEYYSVLSWLMISAKNECTDYFKRIKRHPIVMGKFLSNDFETDLNEINAEVIRYIRSLIDTLPRQQREVFKLRYFEEKEVTFIASLYKQSPQTISNVLHNTMKKIRLKLKNRGINHG